MKLHVVLTSVVMLALGAGGAAAAPLYCADHRPNFDDFDDEEFGSSGFLGNDSEDEKNERDLVELRQRGVDATRVERWNGCIRAFVRQPSGGESMQFFDPNNYREIPLG